MAETAPIPHGALEDCPLAAAIAAFPWAQVAVATRLPKDFGDIPDLPDRLRGAMGQRLGEQPGPDAELLHALMIGTPPKGEELPRPVVIQCDRQGREVTVRVNLAGAAANLAIVAGFALRAALLGGIRLGPDTPWRVSLEPSKPVYRRFLGFGEAWPARPGRLHLRLVTPLSLRRGRSGLAGSLDTLPLNTARRFRAMARAWDHPVARGALLPRRFSQALTVAKSRVTPMIYDHYSTSQAAPTPLPSYWGDMVLHGPCRAYLPLLAFAEAFHAGSSTAFGLGRLSFAAS